MQSRDYFSRRPRRTHRLPIILVLGEPPGEIGSPNSSLDSQSSRSRYHKGQDLGSAWIKPWIPKWPRSRRITRLPENALRYENGFGIIAKNCPHEPTLPVNCLLRLHDFDTRRTRLHHDRPQHRVTERGGGGRVRRAFPCKQRTHVFYPRMYARACVSFFFF